MGTNYFSLKKGNSIRKHIGKISMGWAFTFHGYEQSNFIIKSYKDWKKYLLENDIQIYTESDDRITKKDFFQLVEDSRDKGKRECRMGGIEWYDEEGFLFSSEYFS